jgi:hypothetical protein
MTAVSLVSLSRWHALHTHVCRGLALLASRACCAGTVWTACVSFRRLQVSWVHVQISLCTVVDKGWFGRIAIYSCVHKAWKEGYLASDAWQHGHGVL